MECVQYFASGRTGKSNQFNLIKFDKRRRRGLKMTQKWDGMLRYHWSALIVMFMFLLFFGWIAGMLFIRVI